MTGKAVPFSIDGRSPLTGKAVPFSNDGRSPLIAYAFFAYPNCLLTDTVLASRSVSVHQHWLRLLLERCRDEEQGKLLPALPLNEANMSHASACRLPLAESLKMPHMKKPQTSPQCRNAFCNCPQASLSSGFHY